VPELPEVETVRRDLDRLITGRVVAAVHVTWPRALGETPVDVFTAEVTGARIESVTRRGKYIGLVLSTGRLLVCHLKMTGRLLVAPSGAERPGWVHNWFDFDDGGHLWFQDVRKFGRLYLVDHIEEATGPMGPEPFDPTFTAREFRTVLARRSAPIKPVLLQQDVIAGVGNIYADESLFEARIDPHRPANSLTLPEVKRLQAAISRILKRAIAHRGSSMNDYLDAFGESGHYKPHLKVYARKGLPCLRCGRALQGAVLRQRSAVWCPHCQR
jgi:formamidopyrimidine-DNA glycosylase